MRDRGGPELDTGAGGLARGGEGVAGLQSPPQCCGGHADPTWSGQEGGEMAPSTWASSALLCTGCLVCPEHPSCQSPVPFSTPTVLPTLPTADWLLSGLPLCPIPVALGPASRPLPGH